MDLSPDEDHFQGRLLHQAALWDNVELLQELVASGACVDARDTHGRSALHAAALAERSRCLAALCGSSGIDLDATSDAETGGKTALHIAAERGHVENVRTLLRAGAGLFVLDANGDSPLSLAERNSHRHAAHALREARDALERERLSQHSQLRELVSRGDSVGLRARLAGLGPAAGLIANLTPAGANTLLYVASEAGLTSSVSALLSAGADGRAHPVTRYSPLYVACCHGHAEIVKLLLAYFPEAVQQETVEKWLPLHAAVIGGHAALVTLLLEYPYPETVLNTYTDTSGQWQYRFAFDVNAKDASGQSALYVAVTLGNLPVVDALLGHHAPAEPVPRDVSRDVPRVGHVGHPAGDSAQDVAAPAPGPSPARSGISLGIHAIVSKLTGAGPSQHPPPPRLVRPVCARTSRGADGVTACAGRAGHVRVLARLLAAGGDANATAAPPVYDPILDGRDNTRESRRRSRSAAPPSRGGPSPSPSPSAASRGLHDNDRDGPWTALAIAARAKNVQVAELLLAHGATDPQCRALRECVRHSLLDLLPAILATKAYPDPDFKLNKSTMSETVFNREGDGERQLTYSALCPTTPVMINWRELRCQLAHIRMSWVQTACLRVNKRVRGARGALLALTRLDLANNELRVLPPDLFTMLSLRYLNVAQNKLERLPSPSDPLEEEGDKRRRGKQHKSVYTAPVLQELYLQDNRLEEIPPSLFSLPALTTLDISNNKLRALPPHMWAARALRDLNVALNHLRDLPLPHAQNPTEGVSPMSPSDSSSQLSASPSTGSGQFAFSALSKSSSRSPSIECSESEAGDGDEDAVPCVGNRAGNAVWSEAKRVHVWRGAVSLGGTGEGGGGVGTGVGEGGQRGCPLASLNLSHNQFTCVPAPLACRATSLTRLNMAYNSLRSMSYVTSYPTSLRQLDLSHNEITCWPSLPQIESFGLSEDPLACYCPTVGPSVGPGGPTPRARARSGGSVRAQLMSAACAARRHLRLEGLRTLILANNLLTRIQLTTDDDGESAARDDAPDDDDDWGSSSSLRGRLLFPLLSMLDVSCNLLRALPSALHELANLSVLNISGNKEITDLPPQMGLLSRLWNLNTAGCALHEPLRSMVACGKYKSMDIVGYLKSVLQEARPYARMRLMIVGLQGIGKTSLLECLRQESGIQHRRKPTDHWAKRMGNKSSRRGNVSTVGVDIGSWLYEKHRSTRGPVTFRTWDFGGQQEYYATHQYFLSRRSLYLVVWKATEGRRGLAGALNWLRSIQARAPGSPVIMVATHYDQVPNSNLPESESPEVLQRLIRSSIMGAPDADKLGLPRVLDSVEVSCNTRHNIRLLADIIYSVAFSVKPPGSKEPLLEQRIPATYLALEECVTSLAAELKEPVLKHEEYKRLVTQYMQQKNHRMFRDAAELHQATMFLHENGVLLHYDDATLKELYFVRPQWLCDVLAHVVTVREINPFAHNGIMKIEDLAHVFKASPMLSRGDEASSLGVSLLNKFELALCWDARVLLVPPLLPETEPPAPQLPLRSRSWSGSARGTPRRAWPAAAPLAPCVDSARGTDSPTLIQECDPAASPAAAVLVRGRGAAHPLRRVLCVSYVPCGFWPRLCARVLADTTLAALPATLYRPHEDLDEATCQVLEQSWGWRLWRTGLRLTAGDLTLVGLRERPPRRDALLGACAGAPVEQDYCNMRLKVRQEGSWCEVDVQSSACIEILLPAHVCVVRRDDGLPIGGYQSISLEPNPETLAKVLALVSDHVDLLLEDWYPSLGTRFVHTSEGRCLITRVVPCPTCLREAASNDPPHHHHHDHDHLHEQDEPPEHQFVQAFKRLELGAVEPRRLRLSEESRASDGDSGVGAESNASSRLGSVEGIVNEASPASVAYGWTVEECILAACSGKQLHCPTHQDVKLRHVAPDTLLLDVEEEKRARWEHITRGAVAGRGAFGTVLAGTWRRGGGDAVSAAVKALQPVPPPAPCDAQALHAYKAALSRWERDPTAAACRAYCGLRQELTILSQLRHAHVVPLLGVCCAPLALLLALAPQGALDGVLRSYRGCGARVGPRAARALALQVARALEYLHARRIVYRDLKSENVLVWRMPRASEAAAAERRATPLDVHVKLGDYGISRLAPPSGTKGFGGTEGFMAPEIMRYNGEEEYNEKVDCFSFGMLLYEVVTTRQPFEGHEAVKEAVLEGARPSLTPRELQTPCCMLETMRRCWSGSPEARPAAAALVSLAAAPEYAALLDVARVAPAPAPGPGPAPALALHVSEEGSLAWEVWFALEAERAHSLTAAPAFTHHHALRLPPTNDEEVVMVTAVCRVGGSLWFGDSAGRVSVYSASTCVLQWSVRVQDAVGGSPSPVAALQPLKSLRRVALALKCGRLFLVTSERAEAEGSFVVTELGAATELCCLAALTTPHGMEVWAGGSDLCAYTVASGGVCAAESLQLAPASVPPHVPPRVTLLAALHEQDEPAVIVYTYPNACVSMWRAGTSGGTSAGTSGGTSEGSSPGSSRRAVARLDVRRLAPCSETLHSIGIEDRRPDETCTVTALCTLPGEVYIGTAWGCVVVAETLALRPLAVFRPHEENVRAIVPLFPHKGSDEGPMLATFGDGYRPLLQRYAPAQSNSSTNGSHPGVHCLLWRAQHWLPD